MRLLPFLKPTKGVQIAGGGFPDSGGGGGSYTLPPATDSTLGGVKIGSGVNVTSDGTISVNGGGSYTLPPATSETLGGIKVGSRLSVESDGTLSATDQSYTLPTASESTLGGVKVGTGLSITDGVLSATGGGSYTPTVIGELTADGVQTYRELLNSLYLTAGIGSLTSNEKIMSKLTIESSTYIENYYCSSHGGNNIRYTYSEIYSGNPRFRLAALHSQSGAGNQFLGIEDGVSSQMIYSDYSTNPPASGTKFKIIL